MQPRNAFRATLAASLACGVAYGVVSLYAEQYLPMALRDYLESHYAADLNSSELAGFAIGVPYVVAALVNLVFLFRFRPAARPWALFLTVAGLPLYILFGPWIETGVGVYLAEMAAVLWGAALALMYCPPVSDLFGAGVDHGIPSKSGTKTVLDEP